MKTNDERAYYEYLEKIIRERKRGMPFFGAKSESHEMDILMLMSHIQKKNPRLMERILGNFIDANADGKNPSRVEILSALQKMEKGTVCRWKDESGQELWLVNNGENLMGGKRRVLVFGSHLDRGDMELFKKSLYGSVLRKDIEHVYKKIARDNARAQARKRKSGAAVGVLDFFSERKERMLEHTSSNFEKNFKELVRAQGASCHPFATAQTMISLMSGVEKKNLSQSLSGMGVRNSSDMERLLSKWKNEALNPEYRIEREHKRTVRSRTVEYSR